MMKKMMLGSVLTTLCCAGAVWGEKTETGALRHVVLFRFDEAATEEQIQEVEEAFCQLPKKIPEIVGFEWGTDVSVENLAEGFTHCFVLTFKNVEGREAYLPHPAHQAFVERLKPVLDKVLVIDYFARR